MNTSHMDFHTYCEQRMEVLEELSVDELRQQLLLTNWKQEQHQKEIKDLQKAAMTSVNRLNKKIKKHKEEITRTEEFKDAHWNDWLNRQFGDELYPISPSPDPDLFVKKIKNLKTQMAAVEEAIEDHFDGHWIEFFEETDEEGREILRKVMWRPLIEYEDEDQ